jgi:hypothetical protein
MTGRHKSHDHIHQPRRDRMYEQHVKDPYIARGKWKEPSVCPDCAAVYHKGHWQWGEAPQGAHQHRCPACARIHDKVPAGFLTLGGEFFKAHKPEILQMIRNHESKEKAQHALERIMTIDEQGDGVTIQYTGVHLTEGTGKALHSAYQGDLNIEFNERDAQIRVSWQR